MLAATQLRKTFEVVLYIRAVSVFRKREIIEENELHIRM